MTDLIIQAGYWCDCTTFVVQPVRVFNFILSAFCTRQSIWCQPAYVSQLPGK